MSARCSGGCKEEPRYCRCDEMFVTVQKRQLDRLTLRNEELEAEELENEQLSQDLMAANASVEVLKCKVIEHERTIEHLSMLLRFVLWSIQKGELISTAIEDGVWHALEAIGQQPANFKRVKR